MTDRLCDEDTLLKLAEAAQLDTAQAVGLIDEALRDHPDDARLHLLRGALLIEMGRLIDAHRALSCAVESAPDLHIARFQLGFFELTSGEADRALATWAPLKTLPTDHFLYLFVIGLENLVADRFEDCIARLEEGIAGNQQNSPLNRDMKLIIDECRSALETDGTADLGKNDDVSAASLLLGHKRG